MPLREQLTAQIKLAILSQDLRPGQKLRRKGFSLADVQSRIRHWMRLQPPDHFLVIDPDPDLRAVLIAEIKAATDFRVKGAGVNDCANHGVLVGAVPVALHVQAEIITAALPPKTACLLIHTRSATETLKDEKRPSRSDLVTVVSHWPDFLRLAHSVLAAVNIDPDSLNFRNTAEKGWQRGLRASSFVITDTATAARVPPGVRVRVFRVIADSSLAELRHYVEKFLTRPAH